MTEPKIYVYTRAYNAEKTIRRAIESVLNQSYPNISYLIQDNGSTDGTYAICREYADKDSRIILVHNEINNRYSAREEKEYQLILSYIWGEALGASDFFCLLDADDEYLPDFFERAVRFFQTENLDIIATGTEMIKEETGRKISEQCWPHDIVITGSDFLNYFPNYHWYMRQVWGKLYRRHCLIGIQEQANIFLKHELGDAAQKGLAYGDDTLRTLYAFQKAERIGFLAGLGHRYYIQNKSVSTNLSENRIASDRILHKATLNFLTEKCGSISENNRAFLNAVYANAISDTVGVIANSNLSPAEKLCNYRNIAEHSFTRIAYRWKGDAIKNSRRHLLACACNAVLALPEDADDADFCAIMRVLCPNCGMVVDRKTLPLIVNKQLQENFLQDNRDAFVKELLKTAKGSANNLLGKMLQRLASNNPILSWVDDPIFIRDYGTIYWTVWQSNYPEALDEMAGLILDEKVQNAQETFYRLFIDLAAKLEQANAFIFGKIRLAQFYLMQNLYKECDTLVTELEELGLSEEAEIAALRKTLNRNC